MIFNRWKKLALTDDLTNLYNRRYLKTIKRKRYKYLYFVDVNNLGKINKHIGFGAGDQILRYVAKLLVSKSSDKDIVCRIGGDEFIILSNFNINLENRQIKYACVELDSYPKINNAIQTASKLCFNIKEK